MGSDPVGNGVDADSEPRFAVIRTGSMMASMMSTFALAGVHMTAVTSRDPQRSSRFASVYEISLDIQRVIDRARAPSTLIPKRECGL